ncbi:MAG TPA: ATP-binding protein [Stellaceae bacterium]|nr:ATP-binding protein [Stellaceae bacterium]
MSLGGEGSITMRFWRVGWRYIQVYLRRRALIAACATLVIAALVALAAVSATDRRVAEARDRDRTTTQAMNTAAILLDRQQRSLDEIIRLSVTRSDSMAQQFLDRLPMLTPGVRGAAVADAAGRVQLRSAAAEPEQQALDALAADAANQARLHADAPMLVTASLRDGDSGTALVGFARPWPDSSGQLAGIALIVIDPSAFAGLSLARLDGSPLFAAVRANQGEGIAIGGFPLRLVPAKGAPATLLAAWRCAAIATAGLGALLGLLILLGRRLGAAEQKLARQVLIERALRSELEAVTATAGRTDEVNRAKSQFFAQVTHELRTPLNAILGFSETIRQQMFGPVANARYLEYAGLIHDAGTHLLSLINDLLDNARIEAGKMEIAPIRVSAPALARSALDLVELMAESRDIAMTTAGLATCPDLHVDPRSMKQVLVNLLSNAIKYTLPGGQIEMRFSAQDDGGATIAIADTGIGMSSDDLRMAFEPFGRASAAKARRQQGTGLGLSLARSLVRLHGGDLTLSSRLDIGTTATIALPKKAVFSDSATQGATKPDAATAQAA